MSSRVSLIVAIVSGCIATLIAAGANAQLAAVRLRANPFDRPDFVMNLGQAAAPAAAALERPVELGLRATMVASEGALANINGELLRVGDRIGGYRVSRITEGRVVLRNGSVEMVLDVYKLQRASAEDGLSD